MNNLPYQMISNLRPHTTTAWRLKVRVTRMWQAITQNGDIAGINLIIVDALGGRIHAWLPSQYFGQLANHINEGETYNVQNFVVRQYAASQVDRCVRNDFFVQLYHMTNVFVAEDVDYIQRHVFQFTDLSAISEVASEANYLIDVLGILERAGPITTFTNRRNQQQTSVKFKINDMNTSAEVIFYNEIAEAFNQGVNDATEHPIIIILSSCKAKFMQDEPKLTNMPATRFFLNHNHEAVDDIRDALRFANWQINN